MRSKWLNSDKREQMSNCQSTSAARNQRRTSFSRSSHCWPPLPPAPTYPSWLTGVAHDTYPGVPAETNAVILYDEQETTVQPNGDIETMYRRAYLILRPDGKQYGIVAVPFDNETKITWMKAWCIPKDGKPYELKEKDAVEVGDFESFYSDDRSKVLEIPAATPGNVIGYEYRQKTAPLFPSG